LHCASSHRINLCDCGLSAKPKIDIIAVVKDPKRAILCLATIGHKYKGEYNIPLHYGFNKRGDVEVNLHRYEENHPEIELNLLFRDYLRKTPEACNEYMDLKNRLLKDSASFEKNNSAFTGYTLGKGTFIRKTLKEAGFNRLRFLRCTDVIEWDAAKYYRQTYFFDRVTIADPYTWTFNHPNHAHFILYQGAEIIGYAHVPLWPENRAALRIIVVELAKRNQELGGQFLLLIEKWLKVQGYKSIHIESSPEALQFYKKHDYVAMPFCDPDGYEGHPNDVAIGKIL
jgi:GNAT superfamily N-acetyltransferase